jgi:hypothetical protein
MISFDLMIRSLSSIYEILCSIFIDSIAKKKKITVNYNFVEILKNYGNFDNFTLNSKHYIISLLLYHGMKHLMVTRNIDGKEIVTL